MKKRKLKLSLNKKTISKLQNTVKWRVLKAEKNQILNILYVLFLGAGERKLASKETRLFHIRAINMFL